MGTRAANSDDSASYQDDKMVTSDGQGEEEIEDDLLDQWALIDEEMRESSNDDDHS